MEIQKIKETCLYVDNLESTRAFYEGVLGLKVISFVEGRHVFFRVGQEVLLCFIPEVTLLEKNLPFHFALGKQHIAFECKLEDYERIKQKMQSLGISITHVQSWGNKGESFYFEDPQGHVLEIVQPGIWD